MSIFELRRWGLGATLFFLATIINLAVGSTVEAALTILAANIFYAEVFLCRWTVTRD